MVEDVKIVGRLRWILICIAQIVASNYRQTRNQQKDNVQCVKAQAK